MTTLAGVYLGLAEYDRTQVHGATSRVAGLTGLLDRLAAMTVDEIRAIPSMHPGRADVITGAPGRQPGGSALSVEHLTISESDILDGIALELLAVQNHRVLAITVLGHDRPGIIARTAEALAGCGMNLEDSSMTLLRGHFAMTLICAGDAGRPRSSRPAPLRRTDRSSSTSASCRAEPDRPPLGSEYLITVHGADRLGIVARLAGVIADAGGNITDLTTRLSGDLYVLAAEVELPPTATRALSGALAFAAGELGVDVTLRPIERDEL